MIETLKSLVEGLSFEDRHVVCGILGASLCMSQGCASRLQPE